MRQHPVPQHISSYEFKLVGDMTLKQFFQLAGGCVISLIIYATPLPGFIKWPLVLLFALIGVALAFLPIQERPLSVWFLAFIKAIYSPTEYVYAQNGAEEVFAKAPLTSHTTPTPSLKPQSGVIEAFEQAEKNFLNKVSTLFSAVPTPPSITSTPIVTQAPSIPQPLSQSQVIVKVEEEMEIPEQQAVAVEKSVNPPAGGPQLQAQPTFSQQTVSPVFTSLKSLTSPTSTQQAEFSPEASPPSPPEQPNTIVGQVITREGKILDGAILEIRNASKIPVRALKSNKVGHFITVTPLANGEYEIYIEKDGFKFDPVKFVAEGRLIPPILIKAK